MKYPLNYCRIIQQILRYTQNDSAVAQHKNKPSKITKNQNHEKTFIMKNPTILLITLITVAAFLLGRATVKQTSEVVYTKGKEVVGSAPITLPTREIKPFEPILPYKYIFINNTQIAIVDTAKIISDYIAERSYSIALFDNLHGKLDISPTIQYNRLTAIPYTFTPIEKTVYTKQRWTLFSTLSYNTFNIAAVGAGFFYNNLGMHYRYLWNTCLHENGHELGVNIMF